MPPSTKESRDAEASYPGAKRSAFSCSRTSDGSDTASIRLSGELDFATRSQLELAFSEAERDAQLLELDMRELDFMDCAGLRVILSAAERAEQNGHRLVLLRGPARVDRVFTLTGTTDLVDFVDHPSTTPTDAQPR